MASPGDWWKEGLQDNEGAVLPAVFPVVLVTQEVHSMIYELEMAAAAFGSCDKSDMDGAYAHLGVTRSTLYRYIQNLERKAGVTGRTHIKRF